ncbi:MAG: plastocyanin/azurin family copper-binding protein [Acidimicrobiia bacterium]
MRPMLRTTRLLAVTAAVALVGACGGDDDAGDPTTVTTGDQGAGPVELTVAMTEFAFDPAAATVTSGAEVTVTAENQGTVEHDWVMLDQGREITAETDLADDLDQVRAEWAVASLHTEPGGSDSVTFTAPGPGTYQVICMVAGHFSAGMEGEFTVTG